MFTIKIAKRGCDEMFDVAPIEYLGYLASLLIVISLTMKNIMWLRIVNTLGCICFTMYGLVVGAYPVAISNAAIIVINLYYLNILRKTRE